MRAPKLSRFFAPALLLLAGCSVPQTPALAPESPQATPARHALWHVTAGSAAEAAAPENPEHGSAWLVGSVHLQREGGPPLPEAVKTAFAEADAVVFEVDLDEVYADPLTALESAFFQDERTLQSELSEETWALLVEELGDAGALITLGKAKPWFVALSLSVRELQTEGYSTRAGLDHILFERAKETDKPRIALETAAEQLAFFDDFSREEQEMFLLQTLRDSGETVDQADEIVALWEAGDVEGLEQAFTAEAEAYPDLFDKLLGERNRLWLPRIEDLLREHETVLVVVGAAHLVGEGSLVELLREAGYRVRQE